MTHSRHILITGATGGLGMTLSKHFLNAGYRVTATGRNTNAGLELTEHGARFIAADLLDAKAVTMLCQGHESVIHAAALSASWGFPQEFDRANLEVTAKLLNAAKEAGCRRFVYISSPSVYASLHDQFDITEDTPVTARPLNDYARTKLAAEKLTLSANTENFLTTAIRPRAIIGPDDKVLLPKMIALMNRGFVPLFHNGEALIELTDVRDVAQAVLLAENNIHMIAGRPVNISGGQQITMRQLATAMAEAAGKKIYLLPVSQPIAKTAARLSEWVGYATGYRYEPKLTRYILSTMAYSKTFDLSFAREKLGYVPAYNALDALKQETRRRTL